VKNFSINLMAVLTILVSTQEASADKIYRPTLEQLCFLSDVIIEVDVLDQEHVHFFVTRVWRGDQALLSTTLKVPQIMKIDRICRFQTFCEQKSMSFMKAILFLKQKQDGDLVLVATGRQGSPSVYWLTSQYTVYGYTQLKNPGDLVLVSGISYRFAEIPSTQQLLKERIREGLRQRDLWNEANAQPIPERCHRLAAYTLPATAPNGYRMNTIKPRELFEKLAGCETNSVVALINVIELANPNNDLSLPVQALNSLGSGAYSALPTLRKLRASAGGTPKQLIDNVIENMRSSVK
jgi:hypothetical protein